MISGARSNPLRWLFWRSVFGQLVLHVETQWVKKRLRES